MLDFTKLWDKTYLFGPNPIELSRSDWGFFWLAVGFVLFSLIAKVLAIKSESESPDKLLRNRFFHLFLTVGILLLLWSGMRFENIPWLSTRLLALLLLFLWLLWLAFIARYLFSSFRVQKKAWEAELLKRKYLTGKK